jgi:hypothetical protein
LHHQFFVENPSGEYKSESKWESRLTLARQDKISDYQTARYYSIRPINDKTPDEVPA